MERNCGYTSQAYIELLERQSRRGLRLLPDRERHIEGQQRKLETRRRLAIAFGNWIAKSLGHWDWFINPISFRDRPPTRGWSPITVEPGVPEKCIGPVKLLDDPRLRNWEPQAKGRQRSGPPVPDRALIEIKDWLCDLQTDAGQPIRWMIGEELGDIEARYHCHLLVSGVAHLRRDHYWKKAFEKFGRTKILPFDPEKGGAFYAAKYAAKKLGALHFGGPLPDAEFSAVLNPGEPVGRSPVALSAQMSRDEFRRHEFIPRGWSGWRSKR